MKKEIHPKYHKITATCACGASYETGSTVEEIRVDICSNCHPLFTGQQKILDSEGRVERFKKRYATTGSNKSTKKD
ncbi:MAG: 50S ribosomal protein L31 [Candidatus Margulisbacteria bacterium]|nr:50S ribosomal protein L31 [Candidatus Margulisiibacteriota bacterium]